MRLAQAPAGRKGAENRGAAAIVSVAEKPEIKIAEPSPQAGEGDAALPPHGEASPTPERKLGKREVLTIISGLALAMFLGALNQTIVATALPTIGRAFDDFENLSWVVIAYLLTSTVVAPLYGKLSDIYGRRGMMLVALGVFMAGSAASAAAPSMLMLILGRGLQGIGGGGIVPLAQSIIADAVPPRERGAYQAYTGSVWIVAGAAGPVLGGVIAEHLHWSVIFWLNIPLGIGAALLCHRQAQAAAAARARPYDRSHRRRADDDIGNLAAARADVGRHTLPVAVAADSDSDHRRGSTGGRIYLVGPQSA